MWKDLYSTAADNFSGCWQRHNTKNSIIKITKMLIAKRQQPRQGINTCGANDILIIKLNDDGDFVNGLGEKTDLEGDLLFPLIDNSLFDTNKNNQSRFIILPHDQKTGHPLTWEEICKFPNIKTYLLKY